MAEIAAAVKKISVAIEHRTPALQCRRFLSQIKKEFPELIPCFSNNASVQNMKTTSKIPLPVISTHSHTFTARNSHVLFIFCAVNLQTKYGMNRWHSLALTLAMMQHVYDHIRALNSRFYHNIDSYPSVNLIRWGWQHDIFMFISQSTLYYKCGKRNSTWRISLFIWDFYTTGVL